MSFLQSSLLLRPALLSGQLSSASPKIPFQYAALRRIARPVRVPSNLLLHTSSPRHSSGNLPAVWQDLSELPRSPAPALALGLAGLLPFAAAPLSMCSQAAFDPWAAQAQLAYGATILSVRDSF